MSGGPPKDGIPALLNPESVPATQASFLDDSDRVLGLVIREEARAYPLRILDWHEVVDDFVGSRAVAVTFCPRPSAQGCRYLKNPNALKSLAIYQRRP
jgi:hypothetical protein